MPKHTDTAVKEKPEVEAEAPAAVEGEVVTGDDTQEVAHTTAEGEVVETRDHQSQPSEGVRARRAFAMKNLLPNPDWINTNVVAKGKGHKEVVGRVFGFATGYEKKQNEFQGKILESIAIKGVFQSESYVTGELGEMTSVYLPMAYAEKLATLFEADKSIKMIEVDCDLGLEATGKTIPYEWVCIAYREGEEMMALKRLRNARPRGQNKWATNNQLASETKLAIENKANG